MKKLLLPFLSILLFTSKKPKTNPPTPPVSIPSVTICSQIWMLNNLEVTTYRNGDPIPQVTDPAAWGLLSTGAWCYYNNDPAMGVIYGKLYNWYAVNDPRGLAPTGWHVPSYAEWTTLITCLGGDLIAGGAMKSTGTIEAGNGLWYAPNTGATNSSGFTGLPGGGRTNDGPFNVIGNAGAWWSCAEYGWGLFLSYDSGGIARNGSNKQYGFSVRCLRD
jgi:uncharacterized protein (TIGR02145 family)